MECRRSDFSLPPDQIYLNGAYMSPLPNMVAHAGQQAILRKQVPSLIPTDDFFSEVDLLKKSFARLCNIPDYKSVAIIPSVSYGLASVSKNIRADKGQTILIVSGQFPSNVYVWQKLAEEKNLSIKIIEAPAESNNRGEIWNQRILEAIDSSTALVAMGNVHWADGTKFDLEKIRETTERVGALLIIDGTQSVGALPFDVQKIRPDALICAGYKWLMGPYSIGLAWYGDYFKEGNPLEDNWINRRNSENFRDLVNYENQYQPGMTRFDMGEKSNFILVPMMQKALEYVIQLSPSAIQQYCADISETAVKLLKESGWWIDSEPYRAHHLMGIRPPKHLNAEQCAMKLRANNIFVSVRGEFIRVSPNVYNDANDLIRLAEVLNA